jgi:hypothetical protein
MLMLSHKRHKTKAQSHFTFINNSIYLSLVAVALEAGFASNVVGLPFKHTLLQKKCLSNKAFNTTEINTEVKVLGLKKLLWYL